MHKIWIPQSLPDVATRDALGEALGTSPVTTTLLLQRGITTYAAAETFFNPTLAMLHSPWELYGMRRAVARLTDAIKTQEHITLYGDYDVDGTTAVAMVCDALRRCGADVHCYIPDRREGYGLSLGGISRAAEGGTRLLLTLDCGIRALAPITAARALGMDVIICDHHVPGTRLPEALAILNPQQAGCSYPYKGLSGCGVAFKLLHALALRGLLSFDDLWGYLDLVALSIAADIVPVTGENRVLAYYGLRRLADDPRVGLRALCLATAQQPPFRMGDLVFGLAPPINAAGRMAHADTAVDLFLSEDQEQAYRLANELVSYNQGRRALDGAMTEEALAMIQAEGLRATTVLYVPTWHRGILGIAAARCMEHVYRPTILLTKVGDYATGSARSIAGCDLQEALYACQDYLTRYGGHAYAAGLTLPIDAIPTFSDAFEEAVRGMRLRGDALPPQPFALWLDLADFTERLYGVMERMGPFGPGHRTPVFATAPVHIYDYRIYQGKHLKIFFTTPTTGGATWQGMGFGMASLATYLPSSEPVALLYTLQRQTYRGEEQWQCMLKDLRLVADLPLSVRGGLGDSATSL